MLDELFWDLISWFLFLKIEVWPASWILICFIALFLTSSISEPTSCVAENSVSLNSVSFLGDGVFKLAAPNLNVLLKSVNFPELSNSNFLLLILCAVLSSYSKSESAILYPRLSSPCDSFSLCMSHISAESFSSSSWICSYYIWIPFISILGVISCIYFCNLSWLFTIDLKPYLYTGWWNLCFG